VRVTLIHNPKAGDEQHGADALQSLLAGAGHHVAYRSIKEPGWEEALQDPGDLVVVAGGDGTVRKVFKKLAGSGVTATLLPVGSANNVARTLGVDGVEIARLVEGWSDANLVRFHLGEASAQWRGESRFVESSGAGAFAEVLARAEDVDADPDGEEKVDLGLQLLRDVIAEAPSRPWTLDVDGVDLSGEFLAVEAMNVRETGPNVPLAPDADPTDGRLDVVRVRPEDRAGLLAYVDRRLRGDGGAAPRLPVERGVHVTVGPPGDRPFRVDDELWGEAPTSTGDAATVITAGRAFVDLLVPAL
jgi:diacylglycerol kinase (ATP)